MSQESQEQPLTTRMTSESLQRNAGMVRRVIRSGGEIELTFRSKPYGRIVPHEQLEAERAELIQLRAELARYRNEEAVA